MREGLGTRRKKRDRRAGGLRGLSGLLGAVILTVGLAIQGFCAGATAQVVEDSEASVRQVKVTLHKSKTLKFRLPFTKAVIGSPDIADLLPMTNHILYVQGKKVGTTNISVFDGEGHLVEVVDLEVELDAAAVGGRIAASTGSSNIRVDSANGQMVLSGEATDALAAARALDVAKALTPKDAKGGDAAPVIDAMHVAPTQQVMLKVRFLEVDRTAGRDLGVNFFGGGRGGLGVSGLGSVSQSATVVGGTTNGQTSGILSNGITGSASTTTNIGAGSIGLTNPTYSNGSISYTPPTASGPATTTITNGGLTGTAASLLGGVFAGAAANSTPFGALLAQVINTNGVKIDSLVSALEQKGLVKTLAEPDLISQSGEKASFFAGAQVPVPTVQPGTVGTTPTVAVNYYKCGVTLNFIPTVLNTGLINMHLAPDVCQVSSTTSVTVNGTTIPELNDRSADTTVELRDGQSFAVAGLLQAQDINQLSQLPWLGDVPVLGALFRSTNYQKAETDLVVIVTVHLVHPVAPGTHLVTPFDNSLSANDIDLFLMGNVERRKQYTDFVTSGGGLHGPYGYILEAK